MLPPKEPIPGVDKSPYLEDGPIVYEITCLINDKRYIGSSGKRNRLNRRFTEHRYKLKKGVHENCYLQSSWNKYGEENFEFKVLEHVQDIEILLERESYFIELHKSWHRDFGFNLIRIPAHPIMSDESRERMSEAHRGVPLSETHRANIGKAHKGRKAPTTTAAALIESNKTRIWSDESRAKISEFKKGKYTGEKSYSAKLTWLKVEEIRALYDETDISYKELGLQFGVDHTTIAQIIKHKTWKLNGS